MRWLWRLIRNKPLDCGDEGPWQISRRDRFEMMRPPWTYTFLVKKAKCGCSWRFGLKWWRVMWCADHAFGTLES